MLLSVIIPFYHVEAYIDACLARVARMPEGECEVLLVDDCGSDGSAAIASVYAQQHTNFRVIRREKNGGLSAARNTGFCEAKGEYVYFLDSDDLPEPEVLMDMARMAKEHELDVVKGRFVFFDDLTGKETPGPAVTPAGVESGAAMFARQCADNTYEPMVWQCAYRRAFLEQNGLTMAEGLLFEDELFQAPALFAAARAEATQRVVLRYRQRAGSIMKSFSKSAAWCGSYLEVCRRLSALAKEHRGNEASRALYKRVGQIAVSVVKNIPAYRLPESVAQDVWTFVYAHQRELAGYAMASRDMLVAAQGLLLAVSPKLFVCLYARF